MPAGAFKNRVEESESPNANSIEVRKSRATRKGNQVSQSANFKQIKGYSIAHANGNSSSIPAVNKSFELESRQPAALLNLQPTPSSNMKTNVIHQFQTLQAAHSQLNQKRNISLNNQNKQQVNTTMSNERSKPNSRMGQRASQGDGTSQSRGSRFITSNNRRISLGSGLPEMEAQAQSRDHSLQGCKSGNQNNDKFSVNQQVTRPKTSFGKAGYLDRQQQLLDVPTTTASMGSDPNTSLTLDLPSSQQDVNLEQKPFILKKGERNEGLRSYLRKSLDHQRPLDNSLLSNDTSTTAGDRSKGHNSKANLQKMKRKRDYSKVVANPQTFLPNAQPQIPLVLSPPKTQVKKNLYQESFSQMNEQKSDLIQKVNQHQKENSNGTNSINEELKAKLARKGHEKIHQRSQTSHKINRTGVSQLRGESQTQQENMLTIAQEGAESRQQESKSEERPQSKYKSNHHHARAASITKEVTTANQTQTEGAKKFDNCVSKFAFATKTGFSPSNPYKVNQDSFLALPHLGEYRRTHFFAVADGHGVYGKEVSEYVKITLGSKVELQIKHIFDQAKQLQRVVDSNEVKEALATSFAFTNQQLYSNSGIDIYFSGSTCVSILVVGNKIFCANVGDSRAVLARQTDTELQGFPMNRDHKANEPDEEKRILTNGGRVEAFKDQSGRPMGPLRVWHLNENIPGLAMTRSFGDHCAAEVGCIAEPEILELNLTEHDKFIVLASDGVWEFLSNDEVVHIVYPHYLANSAEKAAEALIREALKKWKQEENVVDDITCIIIFLCIQ